MNLGKVLNMYIDELLNEYADNDITAEEPKVGYFNLGETLEFTATDGYFNEALRNLIGPIIPPEGFKYEIIYTKVIQARRHRKKRINKKWAKKYGYKQVFVKSSGWEMTVNTDGTVTVTKGVDLNDTGNNTNKKI